MKPSDISALQRLSDTLDILRQQCPWDRVQTMESLRYLTIEETFELSEAILKLSAPPDGTPSEARNTEPPPLLRQNSRGGRPFHPR